VSHLLPNSAAALRIQSISAWAVGSLDVSTLRSPTDTSTHHYKADTPSTHQVYSNQRSRSMNLYAENQQGKASKASAKPRVSTLPNSCGRKTTCAMCYSLVVKPGNDLLLVHENRANWDFAFLCSNLRLSQRFLHVT
jgi:hypothetical protein